MGVALVGAALGLMPAAASSVAAVDGHARQHSSRAVGDDAGDGAVIAATVCACPYADLVQTNGRPNRVEMEYELLDIGVFDATAISTCSWSTPE